MNHVITWFLRLPVVLYINIPAYNFQQRSFTPRQEALHWVNTVAPVDGRHSSNPASLTGGSVN
jgi:hypothetical protein